MELVERLYAEQDTAHLQRAWNKLPFISPNFSYLRTPATRNFLSDDDRRYPVASFRFSLFPDESDDEVNYNTRLCMNRGIQAINSLSNKYLDDETRRIFDLEEVSEPLDLFEFVKEAYEIWRNGTIAVRRVVPELRAKAYASMRALELGYRTATIDGAPEVQNSLTYFDQAIEKLERILNFKNPERFDSDCLNGPTTEWMTAAEVKVYSKDETKPMPSRLKYLENGKIKHSSILMKIYSGLEYPSEIRDYIGTELVVENDSARNRLINYLGRETRPGGTFEGFKDTTQGVRLNSSSSNSFGVKKFFLRIPARLKHPIVHSTGTIMYEIVPVEMQILTLTDAKKRDDITEITHFEYKRKQFMRIFPILFPREIYSPLIQKK